MSRDEAAVENVQEPRWHLWLFVLTTGLNCLGCVAAYLIGRSAVRRLQAGEPGGVLAGDAAASLFIQALVLLPLAFAALSRADRRGGRSAGQSAWFWVVLVTFILNVLANMTVMILASIRRGVPGG